MMKIFNNYKLFKHDISQKQRFPQLLQNKMYNFYICIRLKSHYSSLELSDNASHEDIKSAYYKLSLKYHPDKNQGDKEKTAKFREITEAYEVLGNPEKKTKYDHELKSYSGQENFKHYSPNEAGWSSKYPRRSPYRAKTSQYNYEEHFKMHYRMQYEEYIKQRQKEHEFYSRWYDARRNANDSKYRSYKESTFQSRANIFRTFRTMYFLGFVVWLFLLFSPVMLDMDKVEKKSKIYYDGNKEKPKDSES